MTYQSVLDLALKEYGKRLIVYVGGDSSQTAYDDLCFWQNQAYHAAKDVAQYGADNEVNE